MMEMTLEAACKLRDQIIEFLWNANRVLPSFAINSSKQDNYWRDTGDAEENRKAGALRPTVSYACLEARYAQLFSLASCATYAEEVEQWRVEWTRAALSTVRLTDRGKAKGLARIRSTMSGGGPNILTLSHLGIVLGRLECIKRMGIRAGDATDWDRVRKYRKRTLDYLNSRSTTNLCLKPNDPEHPYLVYRAVECLSQFMPSLNSKFCERITKSFDRLAAGRAYGDATPADGVDLAFLWAAAAFHKDMTVPDRLWESCLDVLLELSQPAGDWPLGHALASEGGLIVPSCEVASAILNVLISSYRWKKFPLNQALKAVSYIRPLAERVMNDKLKVVLGNGREVCGWTDTRLSGETKRLQAWTSASHILFLSRLNIVLCHAIRCAVVARFGGYEAETIPGPGFGEEGHEGGIFEVDHRAPVADFIWNTFVRTIDPLAPTLDRYRRFCKQRRSRRVIQTERFTPPTKNKKNTSMVLFGPPGTGKTTYAKALATALKWPLITITPGNFTYGGESGIETAAQEVFGWLLKTDQVVVLLDECDELFRSRDVGDTGTRTLLNFLTASMLPKLAALHDKGGLVFAIATNYVQNMDLAALRGGRIDHHVAVPPPDDIARRILLKAQLNQVPGGKVYQKLWKKMDFKYGISKTEGMTRDEINRAIQHFGNLVKRKGSFKLTDLNDLLKTSLEKADDGRLNDDSLLGHFYQHMMWQSDPVQLVGNKWCPPTRFPLVKPGR